MASRTGSDELSTALHAPPSFTDRVRTILRRLESDRVVARIGSSDHTVWKDDPRELVDRLGWLSVMSRMRPEVPRIQAWADGLVSDGIRDVVLLGMGGSSLAPEVFARTFPAVPSRPRLHVLDSTSPDWIRRVTGSVDPARTHVLLASKSGTTIEVDTLAAHFRQLVEGAVGSRWASHFTAITDPGTVLDRRGVGEGFGAVWRNPADIGGRFSALSFFGLVPAAVLGIGIEGLLESAESMAARCRGEAAASNPGALLGAVLAAGVEAGRDKMTLLASPRLAAFGLWVEQLLAESTGKEGTGILPVVDEPAAVLAHAGADRTFVSVTTRPGEDAAHEARVASVRGGDAPLLELTTGDLLGLGGEMFRWEMATAVAGHLLRIHPFDQPDVQSAKTRAGEVLDLLAAGKTPPRPAGEEAGAVLRDVAPPSWVALMVYGDPSPALSSALESLRVAIGRRGAATTLGLGPRFLHSTGQLHKGGPATGRFVQIVLEEGPLPIPGRNLGFDQLIRAQADGDFAALRDRGRRVSRVEGGPDPVRVVQALAAIAGSGA